MSFLSIIIPAFNEVERIGKTIEKVVDYLNKKDFTWDIIVVDDGSTDGTLNLLKKYDKYVKYISQGKNKGKGAAIRRGMLESDSQFRIFTDADLSTPIYEIEKILPILNSGVDVCIGSRALDRKMVKEHQPFYREWMGRVFNGFVQMIVFRGISDTQCGFKGFTADAANKIFSNAKINGFSFDVEALYLARKYGLNIVQVPVEWYNDARSKVSPIKDSYNMFKELFKIRKLHH